MPPRLEDRGVGASAKFKRSLKDLPVHNEQRVTKSAVSGFTGANQHGGSVSAESHPGKVGRGIPPPTPPSL